MYKSHCSAIYSVGGWQSRAYTLIYRRTQIPYREREPMGEEKSVQQSLHSKKTEADGHIPYTERKPLGEGGPVMQSLHSNIQRAYTLIYRRTQIQYREKEPLGEDNHAFQSSHSIIQIDTDTIQYEGTI
ncbi:hypothetical protein XELAEV_18000820mg [Xenopus laevis]|nr:hypothetical protein XELAEV_18000820mg [Xenopus laevis]